MRIALLATFNESYKRILIIWNYKFNVLIQLVMLAAIFIGATFFLGGGQFTPGLVSSVFIGYVVWFYARIVIMGAGADMIGEAQAGTLEQMYLTPAPTEALVLGRMLATLFTTTIMVIPMALVLALVLDIRVPLSWDSLLVLLITLAGLFGFSLVLSGAALVFKQIESLADLIQNLLLFLTGALLPVSRFPDWLAAIARTLPITQGIAVLRSMMLNGESLSATWADGSLILLLVHSAIYLCLGWFIFKWCERIARQQGSLSHY